MGIYTWQQIADDVARQIDEGSLTPGERLETEESMATRLGVPRHTVHRALHELHVRGLIVRKRRWGTVVAEPPAKSVEKKRVAYLVDFASNSFQADIMMHIEHALGDSGRLMVATSKNDPDREAEHLQKLRDEVDGIICYPADGEENAQAFLDLAASGYPLVLVDRAPPGCEALVVLTDNTQASQEAVADLIARGHERIAFFSSNNDHTQSIRERFDGYRREVDRLGYATRPYERWIPVGAGGPDDTMVQTVSDALAVMRRLPEPPTAAFCTRDFVTACLLEACSNQGLEVGVDFGIATFNDMGPAYFRYQRRLDLVVQQMETISTTAVARLQALMRGEAIAPGPVRIPARFIPAEDTSTILAATLSGSLKSRGDL
ncbi:MAG: substrate-binding domain-containing protein [Fimbriimonas sp.]